MREQRVDVIIPAFERPDLLSEAIVSVLAQSHNKLHLYIVDDASPSPLQDRIKFDDLRVTFVRLRKSLGPGGARNVGVAQGQSPYIAFLDSDDLWHATKLERQLAQFEQDPSLQWVHANEEWQRHGKLVLQRTEHRKQGGAFLERAFSRCLIANSAVMFRRDFYEKHRGFNEHFPICSDFELWLRMLADSPIGFLDEDLVIKRAGDWPQVSSTPETDRYRVLALHRFFRQNRSSLEFAKYSDTLLDEVIYKCKILHKGALKYGRDVRARKYHAWLTLFNARRTRPIR
jgi:glycosyltransferase involved in cell wall biosynthesis